MVLVVFDLGIAIAKVAGGFCEQDELLRYVVSSASSRLFLLLSRLSIRSKTLSLHLFVEIVLVKSAATFFLILSPRFRRLRAGNLLFL